MSRFGTSIRDQKFREEYHRSCHRSWTVSWAFQTPRLFTSVIQRDGNQFHTEISRSCYQFGLTENTQTDVVNLGSQKHPWTLGHQDGLNLSIRTKNHFQALVMFYFHNKKPHLLGNRFEIDLGTALSMLLLYGIDCRSCERNLFHSHSIQLQH